jgi:multidrug resistance efflux pump
MTQTQDRPTMIQTEQLPAGPAVVTPRPPAAPSGPTRGNRLKKWRNRLIVLIMVAAAAVAGTAVVRAQASRASQLNLGELMLTSQPIPVETSLPGLVTSVYVKAGQRVATGQQLGSIRVTTTNSTGHAVLSQRTLKAPRSGVVVDDPLTIGSTLEPGTGFVTLYDPADLTLVTQVPLTYLHEVAPGMIATLTASGVSGSIHAVLQRAVPRIGTNQTDVSADHLELVFRAQNPSDVARLIPGLRFSGTIDTDTGGQGTKPVVFVS